MSKHQYHLLSLLSALLPSVQAYTYDYTTASVSYSHNARLSLIQPNKVVAFATVKRFLVASLTNEYYIASISGSTVSSVANYRKYHSSATPAKATWSVIEDVGTNYFIFGTEPAGVGLSRVDVSTAVDTIFENWGGCISTERINRVIKLSSNILITGNLIDVRSLSTGASMLSGSPGFRASLLHIADSNTLKFFGHNNSTGVVSTRLYQVAMNSPPTIAILQDYSQLNTALHDIDYFPLFSVIVACNSLECLGVDSVSGNKLWSISTASLTFTGAIRYYLASVPTFGILEISGVDTKLTSTRQLKGALTTAPPQFTSQTCISIISETTYFVDGSHFLVMTQSTVRVAFRSPANVDCTSACASCPYDIQSMCFTCNSSYYLSTITPNTCVNYNCSSSCVTCNGPSSTNCMSCPSGYQLSGAAPTSCVPICHTSCATCSGITANDCQSCPSNYKLSPTSAPGSCVPICDTSCATCSGITANDCMSCPTNYKLSSTAPSSCVPICNPSCATCSGTTATTCLTCPSGYRLSGAAPSSCVPICSTSCATCSGTTSNDCLSCPANYMLSATAPSSCVPICPSPCSTCTAPDITQCLTCQSGFTLAGSAPNTCKLSTKLPNAPTALICHSSCLTCNGSAQNQCLTCSLPLLFDPASSTCVDCFIYSTFTSMTSLCTSGANGVMYIDWQSSLSWMGKLRSDLLVTFAPTPPSRVDSNATLKNIFNSKLQAFFPNIVGTRWLFTLSDSNPKITYASDSSTLIKLYTQLKQTQTIPITIINIDRREDNVIYQDSTLTIILVNKKIDTNTPNDQQSTETISTQLMQVAQSITTVSKATTTGAAGAVFLGSTCSLNVGPAFIKLFQIIEILGKFYFTPIDFSPLMDYFLSKLFGVSDLVDTADDILIHFPSGIPNNSYNKLSSLNQQDYLLRANPVFVLIYPLFQLLQLALKYFLGRSKSRFSARLSTTVDSLANLIFEMSFVDFAFYSSYSLMGIYKWEYLLNWKFIVNKLLGIYYLHICTMFTARIVHVAWVGKVDKNGKLNHHVYGHQSVAAVSENIEEGMVGKRWVRMTNAMYIICMMAFQVIITTFQNSPGPGVILLFLLTSVNFVNFIKNLLQLNPYKTISSGAERVLYELSLVTFVGSISLRKIGFHHPLEDYIVISIVGLCIFAQLVSTARTIFQSILSLFRKSKPSQPVQPSPAKISNHAKAVQPYNRLTPSNKNKLNGLKIQTKGEQKHPGHSDNGKNNSKTVTLRKENVEEDKSATYLSNRNLRMVVDKQLQMKLVSKPSRPLNGSRPILRDMVSK